MGSIYVHLSGRDVDNAILKVYRMDQNDNNTERSVLKPKDCPRCGETNPATNKFCLKSGMPLDKETIVRLVEKDLQRKEADRLLDELIKDSEFKEMLIKKIEKITDLKKQSTSAEVVALQSKR